MVSPNEEFDEQTRLELEAAAFRRLINHLDERKDVQNIDLMNLAGFCRNCLSKWYRAEAEERGHELDYESARDCIWDAICRLEIKISKRCFGGEIEGLRDE